MEHQHSAEAIKQRLAKGPTPTTFEEIFARARVVFLNFVKNPSSERYLPKGTKLAD